MVFQRAHALAAVAVVCAAGAHAQESSPSTLPAISVTSTREEALLSETPVAVGVIRRDALAFTRPAHPQQLLGQIPGVGIAVTNGEGHTTAIRQGFTTSPLYLFLEDGIPARATGNFNHNALAELNLPSAGGVEVVRGIGSALYGSDAIAGIINVLSRVPAARRGADLSVEAGMFGWARLLGGLDSGQVGPNAVRADINLTHTDGWRRQTAYDRQSVNLRWDHEVDSTTFVKTLLGYTDIDQQTGANSPLPLDLYLNDPTVNLRSPAYRKVQALRLSSAMEKDLGQGRQLSITPYFRDNRMDLLGAFNFNSPRIENTQVQSFGLMTKFRKNFDDSGRTRFIGGIDLDYSPSRRQEDSISLTSTGSGLSRQYTGYSVGARIYDYELAFQSVAPYAHLEFSPTEQLRLVFGLRYDYARFSMTNNLPAGSGSNVFFQPGDTAVDFSRLSPKLGLTLALSPTTHAFASYNQGFRVPSESQLFRSGGSNAIQANAALALQPIRADQFELGVRGAIQNWSYEAVVYRLTKYDDLLGKKENDVLVQTNNGTTQHQGVELGLGYQIGSTLRADLAASYATHRYLDWAGNTSSATFDYSGKETEASPRLLSNLRLNWQVSEGMLAQLEWMRMGAYFLEPSNLQGKYPGHDLWNLRLAQRIDKDWSWFARVTNLFDRRYADSASYVSASSPANSGALYAPGLPRAVYFGVEKKW